MHAQRVELLDEAFLDLDSDAVPTHVGWTLRFAGRAPGIDELRRHVDGRLVLLPRFRARVLRSRLGLHDPVWVDDPRFDVAHHVDLLDAPAPGGPHQLRELAGMLLSQRLDRSRPLWRVFLIDGLAGEEFALVGQAHHALVDGMAAIEVARLLLDSDPAAPPAMPQPWAPRPRPPLADLALRSLAGQARRGVAAGTLAAGALVHPRRAADALPEAAGALLDVLRPAPGSMLNAPVGSRRGLGFTELSLDDVRDLARARGATVNDIMLACVSLAAGDHLRARGRPSERLKVAVPVDRRGAGEPAEPGNRLSFMFVDLPLSQRDPERVLQRIRDQVAARTTSGVAGRLEDALALAGWLPGPLRARLARLVSRAQVFNAVVSNMVGPAEPLHLRGRRLLSAHPAVPLGAEHGLAIGVLSYAGTLYVGLSADDTVLADVDVLAERIAAAFRALRGAKDAPPRRPRLRGSARVRGHRMHVVH